MAPDDNGPGEFEPEEFEGFHDDGPRYGDLSELGGLEIPAALQGLTLFRDPYLSMQAFNIAIVDDFLNGLEKQVLRRLFDEDRTPIDDTMFLNAQSQMWIFAAYEVMRTWRQRAKDVIKWHANGGLQLKLTALEEDQGFHHPGNASRAAMLRNVIADPGLVEPPRSRAHRGAQFESEKSDSDPEHPAN